jgi:hypothetical protein
MITEVVDFEGSSLEARFIVKRGVDEEVRPYSKVTDSTSWIICEMYMMDYKIFSPTQLINSLKD